MESEKFLYRPVKPFSISQHFGENLACIEDGATPLNERRVIGSNGTCPVGFSKLYPQLGLPNGHSGLDIPASHGQPLYASCEGFVEEMQKDPARGLGLGIISNNKYKLGKWGVNQVKIRYWHLKSFKVNLGDKVKAGDLIGYADNTGYSSGDHVHFECKPVSQNEKGDWYNTFQYETGMFGSIDPEPYLLDIHAQDLAQISLIKRLLEAAKRLLELIRGKNVV